jgi:hypothetical protein
MACRLHNYKAINLSKDVRAGMPVKRITGTEGMRAAKEKRNGERTDV